MGYSEHDVRVRTGADERDLRRAIARAARLPEGTGSEHLFTYSVLRKSLDARKKDDIVWLYRVGVSSPAIAGGRPEPVPNLSPVRAARDGRAVVVGTGPAGYFAARWLALSGYRVIVLERGGRVEERREAIARFDAGPPDAGKALFPAANNYAFGEGGAGTFSDGKLSSRTKGIDPERNYIYDTFITAGAPEEIRWMTHPHVGSDNLFRMTQAMRAGLLELGVDIRYGCPMTGLAVSGGRVRAVETPAGQVDGDVFVVATGNSATDAFRALLHAGVGFGTKNFAIGFRAEHEQRIINRAQWGRDSLPGVKAAEYRLACESADGTGVYSFCMCPGGTVVPASAFAGTAIVNGMSLYARSGRYANAAIVAGVSPDRLVGDGSPGSASPGAALDWLEALEISFYERAGGYRAPAMTIRDFLGAGGASRGPGGRPGGTQAGGPGTGKDRGGNKNTHAHDAPTSRPTSYPFGTVEADLREMLPPTVIAALRDGLSRFCRTLRGFDSGHHLGLESKTSAPIQAMRHPELLYATYPNLYLCGEGSGRAGGIISSAADGLKVARAIAGGEVVNARPPSGGRPAREDGGRSDRGQNSAGSHGSAGGEPTT